jgi:hypothetical protein
MVAYSSVFGDGRGKTHPKYAAVFNSSSTAFSHTSVKGRMHLTLTFCVGRMWGQGHDAVGCFAFVGRYRTDNGHVFLMKRYIGQHHVIYRGAMGRDGHLRGRWHIRGSNEHGPWELWPLTSDEEFELEQLELESLEGVLVINGWDELESWWKQRKTEK